MNAWDAAIVIAGLVLVFMGGFRGASRMIIDMATFAGAFLLAAWFGDLAGSFLSVLIGSDNWRRLAGFVLIFAAVLVAGALLKRVMVKMLETVKLRWADRLLGAGVGFLSTVLAFGLLLVPFAAYLPDGSNLIGGSLLAPYTVRIARWATSVVPAEVRGKFEEQMEKLEKSWKGRGR